MKKKLIFQELLAITRKVIGEFEQREQRSWGIEGSMLELMKQVGDLTRHVMVFEKYYVKNRMSDSYYRTTKNDIADELADILYCLIRISDRYGIDIWEAHFRARRRELQYLREKGKKKLKSRG